MYHRYNWTEVSLNRNKVLREYEPLQPFFFLALLDLVKADTFIDIGANIGAYSLFASSISSIAVVHAFEANAPTFQELERNIDLNQLSQKVLAHNVALSAADGQLKFGVVTEYSGANGVISTSLHSSEKYQRSMMVNCIALDSFPGWGDGCIGLKIDVEGHELEVLKGAEKLLRENVVLQIEDYRVDSPLPGFLAKFELEKIAQIGPDSYYMNTANIVTDTDVVHLYEQAAQRLIDSKHRGVSAVPTTGNSINANRQSRIRRRVAPGVVLELDGVLARSLSTAKRWLRL